MGGNSEPLLLVLSDKESELDSTLEKPFCSFDVLLVGVRLLKKFAMLCKPRLPDVSFSLYKEWKALTIYTKLVKMAEQTLTLITYNQSFNNLVYYINRIPGHRIQ